MKFSGESAMRKIYGHPLLARSTPPLMLISCLEAVFCLKISDLILIDLTRKELHRYPGNAARFSNP